MKIKAINTNPKTFQKLQIQSSNSGNSSTVTKFEVAKKISFSWIVGRFFMAGAIILFTGIIITRLAG